MISFRDKKNVFVLAVCQILFNAARIMVFITSSIIGYEISPIKGLATLPISLMLVGAFTIAIPAALYMGRVGRRLGFASGALIGALGGLAALFGLINESFSLFCVGAFLFGVYSGFANQYRFAAADVAPDEFKSRAISLVLAGGVIAAFFGSALVSWGRQLVGSTEFVGTYIIVIIVMLLAALIVMAVDIPKPNRAQTEDGGRPMSEIMRQPIFIIAVTSATLSYAAMSMLMTATPLAMVGHQHGLDAAGMVVAWHVVAMFGPGFFTGTLIHRFGVLSVIATGVLMQAASVAVALSGQDLAHFWIALFLLGFGWNFAFTGGSMLLTEVHSRAERAKVQGVNDFIVFSVVAVSSLSSGALYHFLSWQWVALAALPMIAVAAAASFWLMVLRRAPQARPAE